MKKIIIPVFATGLLTLTTIPALTSCFGQTKQKINVTKESLNSTSIFFKKIVTKMSINDFNKTYDYLNDKNKDKFDEIAKSLNLSTYKELSRIYADDNKIKIVPNVKNVFYLDKKSSLENIYINLKGEIVFDNITFGETFNVVYQNDQEFIANDDKKVSLDIKAAFMQEKNDIDLDFDWYCLDGKGNKIVLNPSEQIIIKNDQNNSWLTIKNTFFNEKEPGAYKFICIPKNDYTHFKKNDGAAVAIKKYVKYKDNIDSLVAKIATWDGKSGNIDLMTKTITLKGQLEFKKLFNVNGDFIQGITISNIGDGLHHKTLSFDLLLKDGYIANISNDVDGKVYEETTAKILKSDVKSQNTIKFVDFVSKIDKSVTIVNVKSESDKNYAVWTKPDNINVQALFVSQKEHQLFSISDVNWYYSDQDGIQHLIDKKIGKQVWDDKTKKATFSFNPVELFPTTGTFKIHCELANPLQDKVLIFSNNGVVFEEKRLNITTSFNTDNLNKLNNFFTNVGSTKLKELCLSDFKTFNKNGIQKIAELLNIDLSTIKLGTFNFNNQKSSNNHKSLDLNIEFNKEYIIDKELNIKGATKENLTPSITRNQDKDNQILISNILTLDTYDSKLIQIETINASYLINKEAVQWADDEQIVVTTNFSSDSGNTFNINNGLQWTYKDLDGSIKKIDSAFGKQTYDAQTHQATFSFNSFSLFKKIGTYEIYCAPMNQIKDYVFLSQNNGIKLTINKKNVTNLLNKSELNDLDKYFSNMSYNSIKKYCLDDGLTFNNDGIKMIAQKIGINNVALIKSIVLNRKDQVSSLNHLSYQLNITLVDECYVDKGINILGDSVENISPKLICKDDFGKVININGLITKDKQNDDIIFKSFNYDVNMHKDTINYMDQTNNNVLNVTISIKASKDELSDFLWDCIIRSNKIGFKLINENGEYFELDRNQYDVNIPVPQTSSSNCDLDLTIFGQKLDLKPGNYNLEFLSTDARFDFKKVNKINNKYDITINKTIVSINDDTYKNAFYEFSRHAENKNEPWFDENEFCFTRIGKLKFIRLLTGDKLDNLSDETILNKIVKRWPGKGLEIYYSDLSLYHLIWMFDLWFDTDYVKFDVIGFNWKVINPDWVILTSNVELNVDEGKLEVLRFALHYKYA